MTADRATRQRRLDARGAALVEFALTLPILLYILIGILTYGQYFLLAHSLQQIANDAARSTIAGLSADERKALAAKTVAQESASLPDIAGAPVSLATSETVDTVTVSLSLDASGAPLFRSTLIPLPSPVIQRRAMVRPGGFI